MDKLRKIETEALNMVALAKKAGADACDVVVASGSSLSVGVRDGVLENSNRSESDALYLRVFCDKKIASVTSNTKNDPQTLAERAVAMARVSPDDPYQGLADPEKLFPTDRIEESIAKLDLYDESVATPEAMEKSALEIEQAGLGIKGVSKSLGANMSFGTSGFILATSDGFSGSYQRSGFSMVGSFAAGEGTGMERDYEYDTATHLSDLANPASIGKTAGERAVKRLKPRQVKSGAYPVVVDKRVSTAMLGALVNAINGSSVARKTSFLRDMMGKQVTKSSIRIIDDPLMPRRSGSSIFDGEGVTSEKLSLVEDGILQTWLLDSATARELGLETNGRATRGGSGTNPSTTNCYMEAGEQSPHNMVASIKEGLYLTETIGHGINMVTGDYSKGASGYWIENGEIAFPVAEITIAGNLKDMFMNMTPASDLEFKYGRNAPTLMLEGMTIGGK
jgi:PmbA protein